MQKRGQITIFIVVGLMILLVIGSFFILRAYLQTEEAKAEEEKAQASSLKIGAVESFITSCVEKTANKAILDNAYSGGYFTLPENTLAGFDAPYYYKGGEMLIPSNETLVKELAKYIDAMLGFCLTDLDVFEKQGINITFGKASSEVSTAGGKLFILTRMPAKIRWGSSSKEIAAFDAEVPAGEMHRNMLIARKIVESQNGRELCLSCFTEFGANGTFVSVLPYSIGTYIFEIKDSSYRLFEEDYRLRFAVLYEIENESRE